MTDNAARIQTFSDLRLAEQQLRQIPLRKISRISINSLRRQENDVEVYEFLLTKVLHHFDPDEFEAEVSAVLLPELVKHLEKIAVELKDNALSCFLIDNLKSLLSFANILLKFAEYVAGASDTYQLYKTVTIFLEFLVRGCAVIRPNVTIANQLEAEKHDIIDHLLIICRKVQLLMINVLAPAERVGYYFQHLDVEEEFSCLKDVISMFCKIGSLCSGIDTKLFIDAWKAVVKLCSTHSKQIEQNDTVWLHDLILCINGDIEKSFKSLLETNKFAKDEMVSLKLNSSLLRVLLNMLPLTKLEEFEGYGSLLNTIVIIENALLTKGLDEKLADAIRQHLVVGYMNVIGLGLKTLNFAQALTTLEYQSTEEISGYYKIIMHVISKLITNNRDTRLIDLYIVKTNLLSTVISYLTKSHTLINQQEQIYRQLLVHISGFVITCSKNVTKKRQKILEETIVGMILQDSFWVGVMGLDVWSVYLRYHPMELAWQYFKFWKTINNQFSVFASRPRAVFVGRLLQNMYVFLPKRMQQRAWTEFSVLNKENYSLWIAIGLQKVDNQLVSTSKNVLLRHITENCSNRLKIVTLDGIYDTLYMIQLISSLDDKDSLAVLEPDIHFLWKQIQLTDMDSVKSASMLSTLLSVTDRLAYHSLCTASLANTVTGKLAKTKQKLSLLSKQHLIKLLQTLPVTKESETLLQSLSADSCVVIKASRLVSIREAKKEDRLQNHQTTVNAKSLEARLAHQSSKASIEHSCQARKERFDLTQHISDKIDDLFAEDDDDFMLPSTMVGGRGDPAAKRLKLDGDENVTNSKTPQDDINLAVSESIEEINRHLKILQQLQKKRGWSRDHLDRIQKFGVVLRSFNS